MTMEQIFVYFGETLIHMTSEDGNVFISATRRNKIIYAEQEKERGETDRQTDR